MDKTQTDAPSSESPALLQPLVPAATCSVRLSERDAAAVLAAAEQPPAPNETALQAARRFIGRHG
jgi:hypothetical protein